jgi:hypothetical protein
MNAPIIVATLLLFRFVIPFGLLLLIGESARRHNAAQPRKLAGVL